VKASLSSARRRPAVTSLSRAPALCGCGAYSSLETICVGAGVRGKARSAGAKAARSSSLSRPMLASCSLGQRRALPPGSGGV